MTATLDHHYSITLSLLRIVLLLWGEEQMISIPAVNDNFLILHGMDFINWRLFLWPQPLIIITLLLFLSFVSFYYRGVMNVVSACDHNSWPSVLYNSLSPSYRSIIVGWSTKDIDTSCQRQLPHFAWHVIFITLHRMQYIPVVFYSCECNIPPTLLHFTVRSPWCFEQRVITPANNLWCGDLSQPFNCSKRSTIVGLWANVISTSCHRQLIHHCIAWSLFFYSGDCSTSSGECFSNIICLINHTSQYYIIHISKTTNTMLRC